MTVADSAEFFHENATLAIEVDLGEGVQKFCECGRGSTISVLLVVLYWDP